MVGFVLQTAGTFKRPTRSAVNPRRIQCTAPAVGVAEDYVVLGLAHCFKEKSPKELEEVLVVEPLGTATLENVSSNMVPTSYKRLVALKMGELPPSASELPADFLDGGAAVWAENFQERVEAAMRTYQRKPESQLLALGEVNSNLQFSTDRKRILNSSWEPDFSDNVKQDMSIDVYNREADELSNV